MVLGGGGRKLNRTVDRVDLCAVALAANEPKDVELDDDAQLERRSGAVAGPFVRAGFVPAGTIALD